MMLPSFKNYNNKKMMLRKYLKKLLQKLLKNITKTSIVI